MMAKHIDACIKGNVWKKADAEKKHWEGMLAKNAKALMDMPVDSIETSDVVRVLSPIWPSRGAEVLATRIRAILNTAKGQGHFKGTDNPANAIAIKAHLKGKAETKNNAALPFAEMPGFLAKLIAGGSVAELGLAFIALTAVRSGEARLALRSEIVGDRWTIPAERMKMGKVHVVPLSKQALAILARLPVARGQPVPVPRRGWRPARRHRLRQGHRRHGACAASPPCTACARPSATTWATCTTRRPALPPTTPSRWSSASPTSSRVPRVPTAATARSTPAPSSCRCGPTRPAPRS